MSNLRVDDVAAEFHVSADEVRALLKDLDLPPCDDGSFLSGEQVARLRARREHMRLARQARPAEQNRGDAGGPGLLKPHASAVSHTITNVAAELGIPTAELIPIAKRLQIPVSDAESLMSESQRRTLLSRFGSSGPSKHPGRHGSGAARSKGRRANAINHLTPSVAGADSQAETFAFRNIDTNLTEVHQVQWYRDFIDEFVHRSGLQIGPHLSQIANRPFFLVAATGVGKTVAVPVHLLVQMCNELRDRGAAMAPAPFVLVVEPTIPICRGEAEHMNRSFQAFLRSRDLSVAANPFGAVTGPHKSNTNAPIRFVTTGVFERMVDQLDPSRCRVVIDEAHRVLAQSPGVEIAACKARDRGIIVSWMSATVETAQLSERFDLSVVLATEERYPIMKIPIHTPLEDSIGDLVLRCLTNPDALLPQPESFHRAIDQDRCRRARLHLLSPGSFSDPVDQQDYPGLRERAQGILIVVNSHQGENSDTRRIADRIAAAITAAQADIEVLRLASAVVRDTDREASFKRRVAGVEKRLGRYAIVATNVVEMGVTFPSLDYVVTMDTELETVRAAGTEKVEERPLGANAFFQRIGRVGRRRPGVALITRESDKGAPFAGWSVDALAQQLRLEPIAFAISNGDVRELAFSMYEKEVGHEASEVSGYLARQRMPSRPEKDSTVLRTVIAEREMIQAAGLSSDGQRLNRRGQTFRRIGVVSDLELGSLLAECLDQGGELPYMAVAAAACPGGLRDLLDRHTWLEEDEAVLSHVVPFARDQIGIPLPDALEILRSNAGINERALRADATTIHHIRELMGSGYRVDVPRHSKGDGHTKEPAILNFSRPAIRLDDSSELLAVYDIVRWFLAQYRSDLRDSNLAEYERERVRYAIKEEARRLGVDSNRIDATIKRVEEVARHADLDLGALERLSEPSASMKGAIVQPRKKTAPNTSEESARRNTQSVLPHPNADFSKSTSTARKDFVRTVSDLELFATLDLTTGEDARGNLAYQGTSSFLGRECAVTVERGRTSLRIAQRSHVRARVVSIPFTDRSGQQAVRFTLAHTSTAS